MDRLSRQLVPGLLLLLLAFSGLLAGCARGAENPAVSGVATGLLSIDPQTLRLLLLSGLLFLLPGGVVVVWLWRDGTWIEQVALAAGLSVAANALLVYATLSGLRLNAVVLAVFLVVCGAGIVVRWVLDLRSGAGAKLVSGYKRLRDHPGRLQVLLRWVTSSQRLVALTLGLLVCLLLAVRFYVVGDFIVPLWGDGYQHTVMAQLIADNGGLFDSWAPYAPLTTFTYHFGFHANVAAFHWVSGAPVIQSTTWVGQILNVLAVLCLYPLAVRVSGGRRWAGVGAVLVAGLLLPMPMYYVNWGRYTQLAGQVILPVAVYLTWAYLESARPGPGASGGPSADLWPERPFLSSLVRAIPVWIAVAGLAVTHYRVLAFYVVFVLVYLALSWRRQTWRRSVGRVALVGGGALLLFVPWLVRVLPGQIVQTLIHQVTTSARQVSTFDVQYNAIGNIKLFMAPWAWLLLAVSLVLGLWRKQRGVLLVTVWWFALLVLTNPSWVSLPGTGAISNFAFFIAVYIPAGILIGNVVGVLASALARVSWGKPVWLVLVALCILLAGVAGVRRRLEDMHVFEHSLVTRKDLAAMEWIRENTPPDARFLVNSFPAYGGTLVVGSDAGWWMPLLAGRANSVPPLNYGTERGAEPDYVMQVNGLTRALEGADLGAPDTVRMLCERGFTHVYIGQRQGRVNYGGPNVLSLEQMLGSSSYNLVYQEDKAAVLELLCAAEVSRSAPDPPQEGL